MLSKTIVILRLSNVGQLSAFEVSRVVPVLFETSSFTSTETTMQLAELTVKDAAEVAAGNWRRFDCFVWFREEELKRPEDWAIIYTKSRESGLLDESNASVIRKEMQPFAEGDDPDVVFESHSHWVVGHVDGFSIRVFKRGRVTRAFRKYHELVEQMDVYPILDETDYSNREYEATVSNIEDAAWQLKKEFDLPEGWVGEVHSWLSDNECSELENVDDQGGYPSVEALKRAFAAIGIQPVS